MTRQYDCNPYDGIRILFFEDAFAEAVAKFSVERLAKWVAHGAAAALMGCLEEDLANFLNLKEIMTALAKDAVSRGINEGKLIAVASLRKAKYPNIKLGDGTEVAEEELLKLKKKFEK
jgi:hypothetical protein